MPGSLPFVISPDARFLYASLRQEPFLTVSFSVRPSDGYLTPLGAAPVAERPAELICDVTGRFVFTVSYSGHILSVSPVGPDGVVGDCTQVIKTPSQAHGAVIDPSNRHVYIACMGGDVVLGYRFDSESGRLDETPFVQCSSAEGAGPRHLAFGHQARHLYAITEHHGTVIAYERDQQSGELTEIQTVSMLPDQIMQASFSPIKRPPPGASDIKVSPSGEFLYSSDRVTNSLAAFRIDPASGKLAPVENVPGEPVPRSLVVDSDGRHLLCIGVGSGTVGAYGLDPATGAINKRSSVRLEDIVDWVEVIDLPKGN